MPDLRTQLRDYGRQLDEMAPQPSPAGVIAGSDPAAAPRVFRFRSAWAFASAFIFTLAVVGSIWLLRTDNPVADVVEEPATLIDLESLVWTRTPISEVFGADTAVTALTPGGPGFVAVGSTEEGAAVWTSPDALTWTRVLHDPELFDESKSIDDVAVGGPGLVAVGGQDSGPAVWTSPDGLSWSPVTVGDGLQGTDGYMSSVAPGGPGLVGVGYEYKDLEGWNYSTVAKIWTTSDGLTWTQVPHDPEVFGYADSSETRSSIDQVIAGGPGLVAVGVLNGDAAVWTSTDGLVWTPTSENLTWTSTVFEGGRIWDVTTGGPGLVAVGGYELDPTGKADAPLDCYAAVWTSTDGIAWNPVPHDEAVFGGGPDKQHMSSVTTIGTDVVAVGSSVWISEDGITWTRIYHDAGFDPGEHSGMGYVFATRETLISFGEAAIDTNYVYLATERP